LLTEKDFVELLAAKSETKSLDYKQSMNWITATTPEKAELIKDVLAMANTQDGGRIIFGVRNGDFEPTGLTAEDLRSFDVTPFTDFLNRYAGLRAGTDAAPA
jgi:predicted HTH transcriptional regulator